MEWKYKMIFLLLLLYLVCGNELYSQNCLNFEYDISGNRISTYVSNCFIAFEEYERGIMDDEISMDEEFLENIETQAMSVYPNPNDGLFDVSLAVDDDNPIVIQIYNSNGVIIKNDWMIELKKIDITAFSAGIYLLRIIKGEYVCNEVVVKL